ncbi:MAG TPA: HD domain-containing protein [Candidatus Dormibacteraeota bacterium]|jgi:HD superfamily phosphohydrolase|nr:HD domain-containing protein [Candidatus Dormibacteraeota bacterium]
MKGVDTYQGRGLIADPIHQYILYTRPDGLPGEATEQDLIDSSWMQRLRRVPQLQSARWVFPAAEHSRFQHSLGAMHLAGRFAQQLHASLRAEFPDAPSAALFEELMRMAGLLHDVGHGPFGHFFDDNFLADFDLTHEKVGQRIIREELGDLIRGLRRSPAGPFEDGERIDPEWICYLMGKSYTSPTAEHPRWLAHLKPLLSGIYTADNMDYVLRDSYMCGVAVGPIDIERIMYYSFFSEKGLTLDRGGIQAFIMFLNARFYLYTNVYYHRTTRGIDLHLKDIFRDTMKLVFPYDLNKELQPYLNMTEWTLLEEVARWEHAEDSERRDLGREWRQVLDRRLKWRMSHEVVLDLFEPRRGHSFMKVEDVEQRVKDLLPPGLRNFPFKIDMAQQDPRPLNPIGMKDRQIYVYDAADRSVSAEPLKELLKYLPGKVAQCRIFAMSHEYDQQLAKALNEALGEDRPAHPTNL